MKQNNQKTHEPYDLVRDYETEFSLREAKDARKKKTKRIVVILFLILLAILLAYHILNTFNMPLGKQDNTYSKTYRSTSSYDQSVSLNSSEDLEVNNSEGAYYRVSVGRGNRLSLRLAPTSDSQRLDRIDNGSLLYITTVQGNWGQTVYNGKTGWVCLSENGEAYCVIEE